MCRTNGQDPFAGGGGGGAPVLGTVASLADHRWFCDQAIVAIGNNAVREKLMQQLTDAGFELATVIHPRAFVFPTALVRQGSAIMAGAVVGTEARLDDVVSAMRCVAEHPQANGRVDPDIQVGADTL